jgi:hypothetical protein
VWSHFHVAVTLLQERGHLLHIGDDNVWGKCWSIRLLEGNNIFPLPVIKPKSTVRPTRRLAPLPATVFQFLLLAHSRIEKSFHIKTQYQSSSCTYLLICSFLRNDPLNYLLTLKRIIRMNCDCLNYKNINEYIVVKFKVLFDDTYLE